MRVQGTKLFQVHTGLKNAKLRVKYKINFFAVVSM